MYVPISAASVALAAEGVSVAALLLLVLASLADPARRDNSIRLDRCNNHTGGPLVAGDMAPRTCWPFPCHYCTCHFPSEEGEEQEVAVHLAVVQHDSNYCTRCSLVGSRVPVVASAEV